MYMGTAMYTGMPDHSSYAKETDLICRDMYLNHPDSEACIVGDNGLLACTKVCKQTASET